MPINFRISALVQSAQTQSPSIVRSFLCRFIRQRLGARVHFWPFDGWDIPAGHSAIAEVYPALWSRGFANDGRTGVRGGDKVFHRSGGDLRPRRSKIQPVVRRSFVLWTKGSRRDVCRGSLRGGSAICFQ